MLRGHKVVPAILRKFYLLLLSSSMCHLHPYIFLTHFTIFKEYFEIKPKTFKHFELKFRNVINRLVKILQSDSVGLEE